MNDRIFNELSKEDHTVFHRQLLDHCVSLAKSSRNFMSKYYDEWEVRHDLYKSKVPESKMDLKQKENGNPQSQVVPLTYAKVQTFVAFVMSLYTQRDRLFELQPTGMEDVELREMCELVLQHNSLSVKLHRKLRQHLRDIAKFGLGVLKSTWNEEYVYVPVTSEPKKIFGFEVPFSKPQTTTQKLLANAQTEVVAVSPFNFLPDVRYPLTEYQKGEFCGDMFDSTRNELLRQESEGTVAGIKHIQEYTSKDGTNVKKFFHRTKYNFNLSNQINQTVIVTEMQVKITPSNFYLEDGKPLGEETTPIMYLVWIANDDRIIRCEPMGYLHNKFTYEVAQFDEDMHDFLNQSLTDILKRLQETVDWFVNSRVESVSRTIDNQLVVDPLGVEMSTIVNRSRVILLKKGAARTGVDRYVKQLAVQDVTGRHMDDVSVLSSLMQTVSGVNENAMGQFHTGRRSATEARVVAQGAASRLKEIAESIWDASVCELGKKMLLNARQGLSEDLLIRKCGQGFADKPELLAAFTSTPEELVMQNDFFIYEGTLQSEKAYLAQTLMELFNTVNQLGAQGLIQMEISPKLVLNRIYELLGIGDVKQFNLQNDPQTLQNAVNQVIQLTLQQYAQSNQLGQPGGPPPPAQ